MKEDVKIWRDRNGIPHVQADNEADMFWGQGYVHGTDRALQLLFMRILGQGRVSELLDSGADSLPIDIFFRRMNWSGHITEQIDRLNSREQDILSAYCAGINAALERKKPWELRLLGYNPEPWRAEDVILLSRMIGYLTLVQSQAEIERLLVEMVQAGVDRPRLEALFPGILGGLDRDLLRQVTLNERIVPSNQLWAKGLPRMMASNNWVISDRKTASGQAILANDPHLETNRLPNVWSEIVMQHGDRAFIGGSMPGLPGLLIGRSPDLAWGITYSYIDAVDSWVERCKAGLYYREDANQWLEFEARQELIKRKKKEPVEITFYENEHGVLDGDPYVEGCYLATRWSAAQSGTLSIRAFLLAQDARTTAEGMDVLGQVETGWNFVLADAQGDIGFQMSGLVPRRRGGVSGFVPLAGWKKGNDWQGYACHEEMPRALNPEKGFFATANQDLNAHCLFQPINCPMGSYRSRRINQLLEDGDNFSLADMFAMQQDLYSLQAEDFMAILRPLLPHTRQGDILRQWDLRYDAASQGAYLFEQFYKELYRVVFGQGGLGLNIINYLDGETSIFIDFYENFDRVLLAEDSPWFNGQSRETLYRQAAEKALDQEPKRWSEVQQLPLTHILLGGQFPRFLGFDRGPVTAVGGRATIQQGQIYRSAGRMTSFLPSFRWVTDFSTEKLLTNLAGGPSDRRFSRWYCSDLENWLAGSYKEVSADPDQQRRPFP